MVDVLTIVGSPSIDPNLYSEVQQFYTRQMQLLDACRTAEWAGMFTKDAIFEVGARAVSGAENIALAARAVADEFAEAGITRRHWIGMLTVETAAETVVTRCYALVLEIPRGGEVVLRRSTVCADTLVHSGTAWLVQHRRVTRDGMD
jgi:hypothetical protein